MRPCSWKIWTIFFNKVDLPWVHLIWEKYYQNGKVPGAQMRGSFWWCSILRLLPTYKGIAQANSRTEDTILFWTDMWNGRVLQLTYPKLFLLQSGKRLLLKQSWTQILSKVTFIYHYLKRLTISSMNYPFIYKLLRWMETEILGHTFGEVKFTPQPKPINI
jgi:hypothetical protein